MTSLDEKIDRQFREWGLHTDNPTWSSHLMETFVASILAEGGQISDVYRILYRFLENQSLSETLAFFIERICTLSFSHHRKNYDASDFKWLQRELPSGCSPPQGMLADRVMPIPLRTPQCIVSMMKALVGTEEWRGVVGTHDEDAASSPELRELLRKWLAEGVPSECRADVERMAEGRLLE